MKYPFIVIECPCCKTKVRQNQLKSIVPFNENRYKCSKTDCETEIKLITKIKQHEE